MIIEMYRKSDFSPLHFNELYSLEQSPDFRVNFEPHFQFPRRKITSMSMQNTLGVSQAKLSFFDVPNMC